MINVVFYTKKDYIIGYKIEGHSDYYKRLSVKIRRFFKGNNEKDVICASVSSAAYMAAVGLKEVLKRTIFYRENSFGFMELYLKDESDKESEIIFRSLKTILEKIEKEYKGNIIIRTEEKKDGS